jgi:hypothetical protein
MIAFHLPNLRQVFGWLFIIMILSFGIGGVLLILETDSPNSLREGYSEFNFPLRTLRKRESIWP